MESVSSVAQRTNVNDNGFNKVEPMDNGNVNGRGEEQDQVADWLCQQFNNPGYRKFYCKVAYKIRKSRIIELVSTAKEDGKDGGSKLFSYLVSKEMS